jgi:hypothetical protein
MFLNDARLVWFRSRHFDHLNCIASSPTRLRSGPGQRHNELGAVFRPHPTINRPVCGSFLQGIFCWRVCAVPAA